MSDPLYKRALLRLAADAHGAGHLDHADACGAAHNPACGDKVEIELALDAEGRIAALAHTTHACVLTQAAASILGRDAAGLTRGEAETLRNKVAAMLAGKGNAPPSPFDAFAEFAGAAEIPGRHSCVLLPLDALVAALAK